MRKFNRWLAGRGFSEEMGRNCYASFFLLPSAGRGGFIPDGKLVIKDVCKPPPRSRKALFVRTAGQQSPPRRLSLCWQCDRPRLGYDKGIIVLSCCFRLSCFSSLPFPKVRKLASVCQFKKWPLAHEQCR
jgi:hypothetical protein